MDCECRASRAASWRRARDGGILSGGGGGGGTEGGSRSEFGFVVAVVVEGVVMYRENCENWHWLVYKIAIDHHTKHTRTDS